MEGFVNPKGVGPSFLIGPPRDLESPSRDQLLLLVTDDELLVVSSAIHFSTAAHALVSRISSFHWLMGR